MSPDRPAAAALDGPVVVLAGGLSYEREVSLRSGARIADVLRDVGVDARVCDVDGTLLETLATLRPDAVFPALHGSAGEDGAVHDVLVLLGIPYVGSRPDACRLAFDKPVAKAVARRAGIAVPAGVALPHDVFRDLGAAAVLDRIADRIGMPLVVKPARGGSALGLSVVRDPAELSAAMVRCFSYGDTYRGVAIVERYVEGVEVAVAVVDQGDGPRALPAVEVVPESGVFDYEARYTPGRTTYHVPARLPAAQADAAGQAALVAHAALGLGDLSRADLVVAADGTPYLLEVNVSPGMTDTSLYPMAVEAAGLELGALVADLLARAVARTAAAGAAGHQPRATA